MPMISEADPTNIPFGRHDCITTGLLRQVVLKEPASGQKALVEVKFPMYVVR